MLEGARALYRCDVRTNFGRIKAGSDRREFRLHPQDFVIITDDDSPWARHLACGPLEQKMFEAERKYEFADRAPDYRGPYIETIEAAIAGGCFDDNADILQAYRNKIEDVKAGRE